ncbi:MAG: TonB-dependent receptor [Hyphomonadaceae bacterium JAD_PAG50586_4]|nr:MAG: TonB-dependent receptor [Hyphomonadaceae bacterium JAD_PAG50586_4]
MRRITKLLAGAALGLATIPSVALAQDAPAAQESADEIVVTARKREERLQDVPIAITAVTAETLEREQINSVREIAAYTPGLNITTDAVGRAFMSIRGVGTTLIDSVQPGVGIFVDGIYQTNTSYLNNPVVDVARIEVLRGPQGTLFGNNTLGGAINVITRAPTDEFAGRFSASYADPDDYQTVAGSLSGPIIEGVLRGRIAAAYHAHDGFSTNTLAGGNARPLENQSVNGTLVWDAPQNAQITLNAYYNSVEGSQTAYSSPSGPTDYVDDVQLNLNSIATYEYWGVNGRGEFDVSDSTRMTAVLAYDRKDGQTSGDGDFGPFDVIRVLDGRNDRETFTGELRFDTTWNDRLSTLIGVFANYATSTDTVYRTIFGAPQPVVPSTQTLTSQAIFATAFYDLSETLELSAGVRFDRQEADVDGTAGEYSAEEFQPRVTLTQRWSDNHMSYASIARGFRGGGANTPGGPLAFYQGDSVWTYELGDKFTNDDRTLTLNTAIYYNDYQHYIGQNSLTPTLQAVNLNTGDVVSYGVEVEGIWSPNDMFQLTGGLTYNHARITDDSEFEAVFPGGLATDLILFQPDWNFYITPTVTIPIGADNIVFNTTVSYKGERAGSSLDPNFQPQLESYYLVNANLAYEHGDYTIALWGTNLTDEQYYDSYLDRSLLAAFFGDASPLTHNLGITGDGRRVGVRVSARF